MNSPILQNNNEDYGGEDDNYSISDYHHDNDFDDNDNSISFMITALTTQLMLNGGNSKWQWC